jgi:hypothetical protein
VAFGCPTCYDSNHTVTAAGRIKELRAQAPEFEYVTQILWSIVVLCFQSTAEPTLCGV